MCSRTKCATCGKADWSGCGAHVEQVLRNVPTHRRCRCRQDGTRAQAPGLGDLFASLFGRNR